MTLGLVLLWLTEGLESWAGIYPWDLFLEFSSALISRKSNHCGEEVTTWPCVCATVCCLQMHVETGNWVDIP